MLELALYLVIFEFFDRLLSKNLKKRLLEEHSSEQRVLIREKVKTQRIILLIGFVIFLIGTEVFFVWETISDYNEANLKSCLWFPALCILYFVFFKKGERIMGNISTYDIDSFDYRNIRYSLFLRGFENDSYLTQDKLEYDKHESYDSFSEYWFFKFLKKRYKQPVVSVGMTKELDSPLGTTRIYLDDNYWKSGVISLMQYAERIFILVNNRESCIWEIAQSKNMLKKTIFIVDSQAKYDHVKEAVSSEIFLPDIQLPCNQCAIIQFEQECKIEFFENSRMGYASALGTKYTTLKTKRKRAWLGCYLPLIILSILVGIVVIADIMSSSEDSTELYEEKVECTNTPFDEIRASISQIELPLDMGDGMLMESIDIDDEEEIIKYTISFDDNIIDMQLLRQHAKENLLSILASEDIPSDQLQFFLFCKTNKINLSYTYKPSTSREGAFTIKISDFDIENALNKRTESE